MGKEVPIDLEKCKERLQADVKDFTAEGEVRVGKHGRHIFKDNGSNILAVAHLDTVSNCKLYGEVELESGIRVFSRAVDDRLGTYIILDWLPQLDIKMDVLLTEGEEKGQSTAKDFETDKQYNWMIEFDRRGCDVVGYIYEDTEWRKLVRESGAIDALGAWSDIAELPHLKCKGFNWGCGYYNPHDEWAYYYPDHTVKMVNHFIKFWYKNQETYLEHKPEPVKPRTQVTTYSGGAWSDNWKERYRGFRWCNKCYCYIRKDKFSKKDNCCLRCRDLKPKVTRKCTGCNIDRNEWSFTKAGLCIHCDGVTLEREGWRDAVALQECEACGEWVDEKLLQKDQYGLIMCPQCVASDRKYLQGHQGHFDAFGGL